MVAGLQGTDLAVESTTDVNNGLEQWEAREQIPGIKREEVREFLETQYAYTGHRPARRKISKARPKSC